MNSTQIHLNGFVPPPMEPILAPKSLIFLILNLLTLGIYGSAEKLSRDLRIKELKINYKELQHQAAHLNESWNVLEKNLLHLLGQFQQLTGEDASGLKNFKANLQALSAEKNRLQDKTITVNDEVSETLVEIALGTIAFLGQLLANLLTIGLYGVYQNYTLKNRITLLEAQNDFVQDSFKIQRDAKADQIQRYIDFIESNYFLKEEVAKTRQDIDAINQTDVGKAHAAAQQAQQDLADLQKKQGTLQTDLAALRAQHVALQKSKDDAEKDLNQAKVDNRDLRQRYQSLDDAKWKLEQERDGLKKKADQKDRDIANLDAQKRRELDTLQVEFHKANARAQRVTALESEVDRLKNATKSLPEAQQLIKELGPLPLKYTPTTDDKGEIKGAMDLDTNDKTLSKEWVDFANDYNERYGAPLIKSKLKAVKDLLDEMKIMVQGCAQDLDLIAALEKEIDKVNNVNENENLNMLKKCKQNLLNLQTLNARLELKELNKKIDSLFRGSSAAEIMENSFDYAFGQLMTMAANGNKIKLNNSSDTPATPGAFAVYRFMALDLIKGGKLTENGCHGFQVKVNNDVTMLPSQPAKVMEYKEEKDEHGALKKKHYVRIVHQQKDDFTPPPSLHVGMLGVDPVSVKWIYEKLTPAEREHLFNLLMDPVIPNKNDELKATKAFMSKSHDPRVQLVRTAFDLISDIATGYNEKFISNVFAKGWREYAISDIDAFVKEEDVVTDAEINYEPWELDVEVLSDVDAYGDAHQPDFTDLMLEAKARYDAYLRNLDNNIIAKPQADKAKTYAQLSWDDVNPQYHVSHQMIGADASAKGGQRCLFSNLLAIFMTDQNELTVENVKKLKRTLANYLDKVQKGRNEYLLKKNAPKQPPNFDKLKAMGELANHIESEIKQTHGCNIAAYQAWLRDEGYGAANISLSNLTPLEIEIFAYAFGVRIGVLNITVPAPARVDELGRIVPGPYYFFGPNTKEFFLMGAIKGSYYGLFPKLEVNPALQQAVPADYKHLIGLEEYWKNISLHG